MLVLWISLFILSLAILIFSADKFTTAAEKIGLHYHISPFIVGITIVSIGTSLPELASGVIAVLQESSEIVVGNVVGSNISNIFLILGLSAIVATWKKPLTFQFDFASPDLPLFILSVLFLWYFVVDGTFGMLEAILFLIAYIAYMAYSIHIAKNSKKQKNTLVEKHISKLQPQGFPIKSFIILVVGGIFIYLGARFTVDSILQISSQLNIGSEIIALSAVALGTSLPELSVSLAAARKRKFELALGNIIGSNIFNTLIVMAIPTFVGSLVVPKQILFFHVPLMVGGSTLLLLMLLDKRITKWKGVFLCLFYIVFILEMFL